LISRRTDSYRNFSPYRVALIWQDRSRKPIREAPHVQPRCWGYHCRHGRELGRQIRCACWCRGDDPASDGRRCTGPYVGYLAVDFTVDRRPTQRCFTPYRSIRRNGWGVASRREHAPPNAKVPIMTNQYDFEYFKKREAEERLLSECSKDPATRAAHFEMAERYADAVWSAEEALENQARASGFRSADEVRVPYLKIMR